VKPLDKYLHSRDLWGIETSYIFLDGVTFAEEWRRAVKARMDDGSLTNPLVTVTESARLELFKHREMFPGWKGYKMDVVLPHSAFTPT